MPLKVPRILIVDDKEEDGVEIAKCIWDSGYAVRFINYDPESFIDKGEQKLQGVRVIFMDIDLIGDGTFGSGSKNFSAVQQALGYCLGEKNGPYVLITWSSYDEYAEDLFEFLRERMPPEKTPILCKRLNKEDYKPPGSANLADKINEFMQNLGSIKCLIEWEKSIQYAACETIQELINIATTFKGKEPEEAIKNVLYSLAEAEGEQNLDKSNAGKHLYSLLSQILCDQAINHLPEVEEAFGELICSGKEGQTKEKWHQRINSMLHLDFTETGPAAGHSPGDVFKYPEKGHGLPIPEEDINKFLRGRFMSLKEEEKEKYRPKIEAGCQLLLVEITPPCDYSQRKKVWNRYVVAAKIPCKFVNFTWIYSRKKESREEGRQPDYLWSTPEFQQSSLDPYIIIFNSRLILSMPQENAFHEKLGKRLFRIRQPLLSDMMGWLARQASRIGHVSVKP